MSGNDFAQRRLDELRQQKREERQAQEQHDRLSRIITEQDQIRRSTAQQQPKDSPDGK